jgi:hypothetical protein
VVTLDSPERQALSGRTLGAALACRLVWSMAPGISPVIGQRAARRLRRGPGSVTYIPL